MKRFTKILTLSLLIIMVAMTFASCGMLGVNLEKVTGRLMDKGYTVYISSDEERLEEMAEYMDIKEPKVIFSAQNEDEDMFYAIEFKKSADAKNSFEALEEYFEDYADDYDDLICKRKGKVVYCGTKQGVKDALGGLTATLSSIDLGSLFDFGGSKEDDEIKIDFDKAEAYLEEAGYEVMSSSYNGESYVMAYNDNDEYFYATEYSSEEEADEAYAELEAEWDEMSAEAELEGIEVDYGRDGNIVYYGTVDAIKTAAGK